MLNRTNAKPCAAAPKNQQKKKKRNEKYSSYHFFCYVNGFKGLVYGNFGCL